MAIKAPKVTESNFKTVEQGNHLATCIRIIELGTQTFTYQGNESSAYKVRFEFEFHGQTYTDKEGNEITMTLGKDFTLSMNKKANLYKTLKSWLGNFDTEMDLTDLLGKPAMIQVNPQ